MNPLLPALALALAAPRLSTLPLLFEAFPDGKGGQVLFIRDCGRGRIPRDSTCEAWQEHFVGPGVYSTRDGRKVRYKGDAASLRAALGRQAYSEVWLYSGGGSLSAGVEIGRILRQHRMTVRVPNVARVRTVIDWPEPRHQVACVSACTVAFMGGLFRYMDPGATYEVHSGSSVSQVVSPRYRELLSQGKLALIASRQYVQARWTARRLMTHFQNTLLQMAGRPGLAENDARFDDWAQRLPRLAPYTADQGDQDRRRLASEGAAAAQDLIMRVERDAMGWAIADLREMLGVLGPRAQPALRMVEAMYEVSIKETASLTRETMLRMGYLTQELEPPP